MVGCLFRFLFVALALAAETPSQIDHRLISALRERSGRAVYGCDLVSVGDPLYQDTNHEFVANLGHEITRTSEQIQNPLLRRELAEIAKVAGLYIWGNDDYNSNRFNGELLDKVDAEIGKILVLSQTLTDEASPSEDFTAMSLPEREKLLENVSQSFRLRIEKSSARCNRPRETANQARFSD